MKKLKEYIDIWQPTLKLENSNEYFYEQLEDFYGEENIPNKYIELFENGILYKNKYDYINENLKTHNTKKLQDKLLEYYDDEIKEFKKYEGSDDNNSFWIIMNNKNKNKLNIQDLKRHEGDTEKFYNLLSFFNYTYRECKLINTNVCLFIEPIYSEDASDYFDKCHRQAYHFTLKKNIENILKNGLRLKDKNSLIKYPKRIYLWASDKKIKNNKEDIEKFIKQILGDNKTLNDIGIIKIDLYHTNIPIYKDTAMNQKEALFIYNSIPPNLCKKINIV